MREDGGVIALARSVWDHPVLTGEPFTKREAWVWLISSAAWRRTNIKGASGPIALTRGEFSFSVRFLAERWGWSKSRVDRFLDTLADQDMVRDVSRDDTKVYFICKYNDFQFATMSNGTADGTGAGTGAGQQRDKEKEGKKGRKPPSEVKAAPSSQLALPDWIDLKLWEGFIEMRQRIRAPLTALAMTRTIEKLDGFRLRGIDPNACLEHSIVNAYRGVFAPKEDHNSGTRTRKATGHSNFFAAAAEIINDELGLQSGRAAEEGDDRGAAGEAGRPLLRA